MNFAYGISFKLDNKRGKREQKFAYGPK